MKPGHARVAVLAFLAFGADSRAAETGFYAGADMAWVMPTVHKSDGIGFVTFSGSTHVFPESVHYDESALGWSAFIGYRFNPYLAAELAYADYGSVDVQEVYELPGPVPGPGSRRVVQDSKSKVSGPMASVLGVLPVSARFEVFGRAGVMWARQELQLSQQFSFIDAEAQWVLGVGLQAELSRAWSARLEYQRIDAIPDTVLSGDIDYGRVLAGATYRLGSSREVAMTGREALAASAERGFYAVADFGVSEPTVGKSDGFFIAIVPFPGIIFHVSPTSASASGSEPGFGATFGYRINRYLAAELSYTDFGSIDIAEEYLIALPRPFPPREPTREVVNLNARVSGPSLNVLGKLPVGDYAELFVRGGVLFADEDVSRNPGDVSASNVEEAWVVGGGVDVKLAPRWSARFAYESVDRLGKTEFSGPIRLERFVFGVSYDF